MIANYGDVKLQNSSCVIFFIFRHIDDGDKVSVHDQKLLLSRIRMLLYFMKYSMPNIANTPQELSKVMDGANPFDQVCT